jgi:tRNA(Ile)-lysidine synthase
MHPFAKKTLAKLQERQLLENGKHIMVGVSGGADSVALLHALADIRADNHLLEISVAHLNHGIRSEAADDAAFVEELCRNMAVPFYTEKIDVPKLANAKGLSIEMAAREARYTFFAQTCAKCGAVAVATAHTLNDQAETVLLKLCRGAGSGGLDGIEWSTIIGNVRVIRPMLNISRHEVEEYLTQIAAHWRTDATNADTAMQRNFVRHKIIPLLHELNPAVNNAISRTAEILHEDNSYMDSQARLHLEKLRSRNLEEIERRALLRLHPAILRRVIRLILKDAGIPTQQIGFKSIENIVRMLEDNNGSCQIVLSPQTKLIREYDKVRITRNKDNEVTITDTRITIPGTTELPTIGLRVTTEYQTGFDRKPPYGVGIYPASAVIHLPPDSTLKVRSWIPGDRMSPIGMQGTRKIQDIFCDAKIPASRRELIPLFIVDNEIVWIPGYRISRHYAMPDQSAKGLRITVDNPTNET